MRLVACTLSSSLVVVALATTAQAATPTVTPAVLKAPGAIEARFTFTGVEQDSSVTIAPDALVLPADGFTDELSTVRITGTRVEGGGALTPDAHIAAESGACYRGGVFPNDPRTYRLDVPARTTVTVVVAAEVPLGLPGHPAGVTLTHGALQVPGAVATTEQLVETAQIQRSGYVDGVSLKASRRKAGRVTFTGRVIPARRGAKVTFVSQAVPDGSFMDVSGIGLFTEPGDAFDARNKLKKLGSTRTAAGGTYRVTLKVPANVGVAARTAGAHAGSSCGVLGDLEPVAKP